MLQYSSYILEEDVPIYESIWALIFSDIFCHALFVAASVAVGKVAFLLPFLERFSFRNFERRPRREGHNAVGRRESPRASSVAASLDRFAM